ncbi:MAG: GNAT family N-acetyltransferase [Clostridium sp.]|nr:GNAT family N-acetyltransferase [Clostridium sp.]
MNREEIIKITKDDFESFFRVMKNAFPEIEIRSYEGQKKIFDEDGYRVTGYKNNEDNVTAFIASWNFEDFKFIEHFAVDENLRGNGIGSALINEFLKVSGQKIVLEVEFPEDDISERRIEFYKKIGMKLNEYEYVQPPLQEGKELLPLKIMSYPEELTEEEFKNIQRDIYEKVYKYDGIK